MQRAVQRGCGNPCYRMLETLRAWESPLLAARVAGELPHAVVWLSGDPRP